jgi:hypothetical protein
MHAMKCSPIKLFKTFFFKNQGVTYTPEELERLESLRVEEFVHTHVYDMILLKKGEMDVDLPTLFRAIGWSFLLRFLGSPLLVEGI